MVFIKTCNMIHFRPAINGSWMLAVPFVILYQIHSISLVPHQSSSRRPVIIICLKESHRFFWNYFTKRSQLLHLPQLHLALLETFPWYIDSTSHSSLFVAQLSSVAFQFGCSLHYHVILIMLSFEIESVHFIYFVRSIGANFSFVLLSCANKSDYWRSLPRDWW